jgi:hypothetical protein
MQGMSSNILAGFAAALLTTASVHAQWIVGPVQSFASPLSVFSGTTGYPRIAAGERMFLTVFISGNAVHAIRVAETGEILDRPPLVVAQGEFALTQAQVARNGDGFVVTWNSCGQVRVAMVAPNGVVSPAMTLGPGASDGEPSNLMACAHAGCAVIAGYHVITFRGSEPVTTQAIGETVLGHAIASDGNGFVVAWEVRDAATGKYHVVLRPLALDGYAGTDRRLQLGDTPVFIALSASAGSYALVAGDRFIRLDPDATPRTADAVALGCGSQCASLQLVSTASGYLASWTSSYTYPSSYTTSPYRFTERHGRFLSTEGEVLQGTHFANDRGTLGGGGGSGAASDVACTALRCAAVFIPARPYSQRVGNHAISAGDYDSGSIGLETGLASTFDSSTALRRPLVWSAETQSQPAVAVNGGIALAVWLDGTKVEVVNRSDGLFGEPRTSGEAQVHQLAALGDSFVTIRGYSSSNYYGSVAQVWIQTLDRNGVTGPEFRYINHPFMVLPRPALASQAGGACAAFPIGSEAQVLRVGADGRPLGNPAAIGSSDGLPLVALAEGGCLAINGSTAVLVRNESIVNRIPLPCRPRTLAGDGSSYVAVCDSRLLNLDSQGKVVANFPINAAFVSGATIWDPQAGFYRSFGRIGSRVVEYDMFHHGGSVAPRDLFTIPNADSFEIAAARTDDGIILAYAHATPERGPGATGTFLRILTEGPRGRISRH